MFCIWYTGEDVNEIKSSITMKMFFLLLLIINNLFAKECQIFLNGKIKQDNIILPPPFVFYPNDYFHSNIATWSGTAKVVSFINPSAQTITCGSNHLTTYLDPLKASGYLPEFILTNAWITKYPNGILKTIPPQQMYGFGSTSEYPFPEIKFDNTSNFLLDVFVPEVKDICDLTKVDLPSDVEFSTYMLNESIVEQYTHPTEYGDYKWDASKVKDWGPVTLTLEKPYLTIACNKVYEYEALIEWPYEFNEMGGLCKGGVNRKMEMKGTFTVDSENKITGILNVKKPTVSYYGDVVGNFSGSDFSIAVDGFVKNDSSGKRIVELSYFDGGDGITWNYSLSCFGGKISNSEFAAAKGYLKVLQREEIWSEDDPGYIIYDENFDSKEYDVNMGGQGNVHVKRTWKKIL